MGQVTRTNFGLSKITRFTNAQILALPTTTPTIVAAVAGKVILPNLVSYILSPWVADYSNIDVAAKIGVDVTGAVYSNPTFAPGAVLAQGHAAVIWSDVGREFDYTAFALVDLAGLPLLLTVTNAAAGNFTGGNATQVLTVQVFYDVIGV